VDTKARDEGTGSQGRGQRQVEANASPRSIEQESMDTKASNSTGLRSWDQEDTVQDIALALLARQAKRLNRIL
jgi:hypothetical protein